MTSLAISTSANHAKLAKAGIMFLTAATATISSPSINAETSPQKLLKAWERGETITSRVVSPRSGDVSVLSNRAAHISGSLGKNIPKEIDLVSPSDMLNIIFSSLGVNVSDLEKVIGVKRATIYNWKKGGEVKEADTFARLKEVYLIALQISSFNNQPFGRKAKSVMVNGKSYMDLLSEDQLDNSQIIKHAKILAQQNKKSVQALANSDSSLTDIDSLSGEVFIDG